jgi:hypothetical protein
MMIPLHLLFLLTLIASISLPPPPPPPQHHIIIFVMMVMVMMMMINVIPVIITVSIETISSSFGKYLSNVLGKHKIKELQKAAIFVTAHILRKVLK